MNDFTDIVSKVMEVRPDDGDYTGEDGLLYCGKCHTPKEAYPEKAEPVHSILAALKRFQEAPPAPKKDKAGPSHEER